jgi:hypothetical protein
MEDYIFLIIAVLISIFAAINKNKKKEGNKILQNIREPEPENFMMDLFPEDDFLDEDFVQEPLRKEPLKIREPLIAPSPLLVPGNYKSTFKSTLPDRSVKSIQSSFKKETPPKNEETFVGEETSGILEDFSLRKAIIYSEILKPKYLQ